jgi:formate/nitrite transporter FocA (FNT family)
LPVLTRRDARTLFAALRLWVIVLFANLVGTWIFAGILVLPTPFTSRLVPALEMLAHSSLESGFATTTLKAILAGWLNALMVWLPPHRAVGCGVIIAIVTYVVSLCELSHVIAGWAEAAYMVLRGEANVANYVGRFLAPTLLGNVIGGVALVGLLNHASIAPEMNGRSGA